MNAQQLEVMKLRITPGYKLVMIAMIENPEMNREQLSNFLNMDKTQLSTTTKKLQELSMISMVRNSETGHRAYTVLV
jgi:DNA-binding MarR family transcriptional regulator